MSHSVAKNAAFMTVASIAQKVISFVYFTLIARSIGVEGTGKYFLALSFTTIFVVFVDLGLTNVLVREAARVREHIQKYVSTILSVKLVLGVLAYVAVFWVSKKLYPDTELRSMILLSGVTMLFDSFNLTVYGVLRAIGDLRFESLSITFSQFASLILGSIFLFFHLPLIFLILAFTIPSALNAMYASYTVFHRYQVTAVPRFDAPTFVWLSKITIPFALAAIFARVYSYIDTLLLGHFLGSEAVGFYSTPYKITFAFQFIPLALTAALYPRLSEYFVHHKEKFSVILTDSLKYLLIVSVPIAIGIAVLARPLIVLLYKEDFLPSVLPLQIIIVSLIFSFASFPVGAALNAGNKQVTQTTIVGIVMVVNIIMNVILIPKIGVVGAALSALIGNILLTVIGYYFLHTIVVLNHKNFFFTCAKVLLSGLVMGLVVYFVNDRTNLFSAIVSGAFVYTGLVLRFRCITVPELQEAFRLLKK